MSDDHDVRQVLSRIDAAWRRQHFDDLASCFHADAVIVGPKHAEFARGRERCVASYVEFATDADIIEYTESGHALRLWGNTAVYTFAWQMHYQRGAEGPSREQGTDMIVLGRGDAAWQVVFRQIEFAPAT